MPDEIDLLRAFRADTPGPDDTAWERARAAVALAEDAAAPDPGSHRPRPRGIRRFRRERTTRGRVILAAAVAVAVGVGNPAPVRGGEGLGRQVLGQVSANTPGDEPVNRREVRPERILEVGRRPDWTGSQFLVHA